MERPPVPDLHIFDRPNIGIGLLDRTAGWLAQTDAKSLEREAPGRGMAPSFGPHGGVTYERRSPRSIGIDGSAAGGGTVRRRRPQAGLVWSGCRCESAAIGGETSPRCLLPWRCERPGEA